MCIKAKRTIALPITVYQRQDKLAEKSAMRTNNLIKIYVGHGRLTCCGFVCCNVCGTLTATDLGGSLKNSDNNGKKWPYEGMSSFYSLNPAERDRTMF